LVRAVAAGLFGKWLGRTWSHRITIAGVAVALLASIQIFQECCWAHFQRPGLYLADFRHTSFQVGFLI